MCSSNNVDLGPLFVQFLLHFRQIVQNQDQIRTPCPLVQVAMSRNHFQRMKSDMESHGDILNKKQVEIMTHEINKEETVAFWSHFRKEEAVELMTWEQRNIMKYFCTVELKKNDQKMDTISKATWRTVFTSYANL